MISKLKIYLGNMTAEKLIEILQKKVADNEPISPAYWIESALRVNQLSSDLDNALAHYEAEMNEIQAVFIEADMPASKAKIMARSKVDYKEYLIKKALKKRIEEWIMLAKKRSVINM